MAGEKPDARSRVSETADTLRHAEQELGRVIVDRENCGDVLDAIAAYGDALLAHHNAVEAEKNEKWALEAAAGLESCRDSFVKELSRQLAEWEKDRGLKPAKSCAHEYKTDGFKDGWCALYCRLCSHVMWIPQPGVSDKDRGPKPA